MPATNQLFGGLFAGLFHNVGGGWRPLRADGVPADVDIDFAAGRGFQGSHADPASLITCTRSTVGHTLDYAKNANGAWQSFAANVPRITDLGLLREESRTNIFLNAATPATQSITVANGSTYTIWVEGPGSIVLSGAATGTVTEDHPVTVTTSSTSLTCTISGSLDHAQVELGGFATSKIVTGGAAVTRSGDVIQIKASPSFGSAATLLVEDTPIAGIPSATFTVATLSDGTSSNRLNLLATTSNELTVRVIAGGSATNPGNIADAFWNTVPRRHAIAATVGTDNAIAASGGALSTPASPATMPTLNKVYIGSDHVGAIVGASIIRRVTVWANLRVSNSELQRLTTLNTNILFRWGSFAMTGPYTNVPDATHYVVLQPSGDTPSADDLASHRFHHHVKVAINNGRCWLMHSSGYGNETDGGMFVVGETKLVSDSGWSAPFVMGPRQSDFEARTVTSSSGRIVLPRRFIKKSGVLYAVMAVQRGDDAEGHALFARQCNDDGTLGTLYRITAPYTSIDSYDDVPYSADLAELLADDAVLFGQWGGPSATGVTPYWTWRTNQPSAGSGFSEPTTLYHDGLYYRIWRSVTTSTTNLWQQVSADGKNWSRAVVTSMPNAPSSTELIKFSDGRVGLVGNPRDVANDARDPLYLMLFNPATLEATSLYAVRAGLTHMPTYSGTSKNGSIAYPGIDEEGGVVLVGYSTNGKERIGATQFMLTSV